MSREKELFLDILRHSLWNEGVYHFQHSNDNDDPIVSRILKIATDQTLLGIVGNTLLNNTEGVSIEKKKGIKLGYKILKIQTRHSMVESVIESLSNDFSNKGIDLFLLKGEGVGSLYPDPTLRQSGDIDLFVGKEHYNEGKKFLDSIKDQDKSFSESAKHFECHYKNISVELHKYSDKFKFRPCQDRYFQNLTVEEMRSSNRTLKCGSSEIKIPTAYFDAIFSLEHLWNHMLKGGVGLRQVCDWSMILHSYGKELDINKLEVDLKKCHLYEAWQYIGYIAVNFIGLPKDECPLYSENNRVSSTA
ncbi:MAG: nucleotidyltransferase family protein [Bacteroidales bacterium]|nr:nucleotidyltransferase family protein [Bacteroidales bacterium]